MIEHGGGGGWNDIPSIEVGGAGSGVTTNAPDWWSRMLGFFKGEGITDIDLSSGLSRETAIDLAATLFSTTDPVAFLASIVFGLFKNLPTWIEGCENTHRKATAIYDKYKQAEATLIADNKMKPVKDVKPYDNNPVPATLAVRADGITSTKPSDVQPKLMAQRLMLGQNQRVKIDYDLSSEYWSSTQGCQAEWSWVKIISNRNGAVYTWFEKICKAQGAFLQGTQGKEKGSEHINLPAGEYIVLACCTGDTPYKVVPKPGESYADIKVEYATPKPMLSLFGNGFFKYVPWLLMGGGLLYAGYFALTKVRKAGRTGSSRGYYGSRNRGRRRH